MAASCPVSVFLRKDVLWKERRNGVVYVLVRGGEIVGSCFVLGGPFLPLLCLLCLLCLLWLLWLLSFVSFVSFVSFALL